MKFIITAPYMKLIISKWRNLDSCSKVFLRKLKSSIDDVFGNRIYKISKVAFGSTQIIYLDHRGRS